MKAAEIRQIYTTTVQYLQQCIETAVFESYVLLCVSTFSLSKEKLTFKLF